MFSINTAVTYSSAVATTTPPTNKKKQIITDGKKNQIYGKCSTAIYGTQGTIYKSSVYQFSLSHRHVTGFPKPAKKTVYVKPIGNMIEIHSVNC